MLAGVMELKRAFMEGDLLEEAKCFFFGLFFECVELELALASRALCMVRRLPAPELYLQSQAELP